MEAMRPRASKADVTLLQWPEEDDLRARLEAEGQPRLLLVHPTARPPTVWTTLEDWIRRPAEPADLHARIAALRALSRRNAPLHLDDDDAIVRRGNAWVALPAVELAVLRPLLARQDRVVPRGLLLAAARDEPGDYTTQMLDSTIQRLRKRLRPLGVTLHAVRGCGYLLELEETAT